MTDYFRRANIEICKTFNDNEIEVSALYMDELFGGNGNGTGKLMFI